MLTADRNCRCPRIRWSRSLFAKLCQAAGVSDPAELAEQLMLLYDGAVAGTHMDRDPARARLARTVAETLLNAALSQA